MSQFPLATRTFTVKRRGPSVQGGNQELSLTTITTGLSVYVQVTQGTISDGKGGMQFVAVYRGSTFSNAPLVIGDLLYDETENNPNGITPSCYQVDGLTIYPTYMFLRLTRKVSGV